MRPLLQILTATLILTPTCAAQTYKGRDENGRDVSAELNGRRQRDLSKSGLSAIPHLRFLDVTYGAELNQDDIDYLATLTQITDLKLGQAAGLGECAIINADLAKLSQLKRLEWLELCKRDMKDEDLAFVAKLPKIKWVVIEATRRLTEGKRPPITDKCAEYLRRARSLERIEILGQPGLGDAFISKIAELPKLKTLSLYSGKYTDKSLGLLALKSRSLTSLEISSDQFTDNGIGYVSKLTTLETLDLSSKQISGAGVRGLAGMKNLKDLRLASPDLSAGWGSSIKALQQLRLLELTPASIDDADFEAIADLPKLETLILRESLITNDQFEMLRGHPSLKSAFLCGSQLEPKDAMEVIRSLPKLAHIHFGRNEELRALANEEMTRKKKQHTTQPQ